jgi:hypothetical protein
MLSIAVVALCLCIGGCANMTTTEQRTLSGAGIGALGGAAIAAIASTSVAAGAAIGAGVGAGAGYLYSLNQNQKHAAYHPTKSHERVAHTTKQRKQENGVRVPDQQLAVAEQQ